MAWTLNGIRIYVQEAPESTRQIISRHHVLGGGTLHQIFGDEEKVITLAAVAVGNVDKAALLNLADDGVTVTLVTPYASETVYVGSVQVSQRLGVCQNLRTDLAEDAPVFDCEIELYVEE